MLFDDDELIANEEILYEGKPSFLYTCKNVIIGFLLIAFILGSSLTILSTISELQVYSYDSLRYPIAQFAAYVIYGLVFLILIWIAFKLVKWYFIKYIVTDGRIISKSGIISENKSYMSFKNIQDIIVSRSILQKLFGVGTVVITSSYDNSNVVLENIRSPKEVEEIIFHGMNSLPVYPGMNFPNNNQNFYPQNGGYNPYQNQNNQFNKRNPYDNQDNQFNQRIPYENQGYPERNIKGDYLKQHYEGYNPEEEYKKGLDDPLSTLSNEPLNNNYNDNEIYYNDYHDPNEFDETINQAVRNIEGNMKFKDDAYYSPREQNRNYMPGGINNSRSNITYEGNSFRDDYEHSRPFDSHQNYTAQDYNPNLRSNINNNRPRNYPPQGANYDRGNNYQNPYNDNGPYQQNNRNPNLNQFDDNRNYNPNPNQYGGNRNYNSNSNRFADKRNYQNNQNSNYNQHNQENHYRNNHHSNQYENKNNYEYGDVKKKDTKSKEDKHEKKNRKSVLAKHARKFQK